MTTIKYLIPIVLPLFLMCSAGKKELADVEKKIASSELSEGNKAISEPFDCESFWGGIEFPACPEGESMVINRRKEAKCSHIDVRNGTIIIQTYASKSEALKAYSKKLKGLSLAPQQDHTGQTSEINETNVLGERSFELTSSLEVPMVCHFQRGKHTVLFTYNKMNCWKSDQFNKVVKAIDDRLMGM